MSLRFQKRCLNIKRKAVKSFSHRGFQILNVPTAKHRSDGLPSPDLQPSSSICGNCHSHFFIPTITGDIFSATCFLSISGLEFLYFNVDWLFSFDLSSLMYNV
ncbi:hypothetical protein XENOCAPTIV_001463 [Xenoophorus captivus]|uniref:Uncharacterized protein n=1 Tax=Xenoophorus captivus TaxID=1517983 RepID=A0ABV0QDN1_9TELE